MKRIISILLFAAICVMSVGVNGQTTDYQTSVVPDLKSGIGFDFSRFTHESQIPLKMAKIVDGGEVDFDGSLIIRSPGCTGGSEAYVQAGAFSADSAFSAEFEMKALKECSGTLKVYLRDGRTYQPGCEISLISFDKEHIVVGGKTILCDTDIPSVYRITVCPQSGRIQFYRNGILESDTVKDCSAFDFSGFYLRFHTSAKSGTQGSNMFEIKKLYAVSDVSLSDTVSVMPKGICRDGYEMNNFSDGTNEICMNIANSSDKEQSLYFAYTQSGEDTVYSAFVIAPQSCADYRFSADIQGFEKKDKLSMVITDSQKNPLTLPLVYTSNGYTPPTPLQIISDLAGAHPRVAANREDFEKAVSLFSSDSEIGKAYEKGYDKTLADKLISVASDGSYLHVPCPYNDNDNLRLLAADTVLRYCKALSAQYVLTGNEKYKTRLWLEIKNAASYPDWNPKHFLDTAALCYAFALSYDWLYDSWTAEQKTLIENALFEKGLSCYLSAYRGTADSYAEWRYRRNNWNVVCNGGAVIGALALADVDRYSEVCAEIICEAMESMNTSLKSFSPGGAWYEGVGYWAYTMQYLTVTMASLKNTLGTFYGIDKVDGISKTSLFPLYTTGEYGINLNDDGAEEYVSIPENLYLAKVFDTPSAAAYRIEQLKENDNEAEILDLLWYEEEFKDADVLADIGAMTVLGGSDIAVMRNKNAFAAIHWGYNNISHGHLDCGTLFYDSGGERWLKDPGADDYNLYDYFNVAEVAYPKGRWAYYRNRAEAHNTIVIGNDDSHPDQIPDSGGKLKKAIEWNSGSFAVVDMTECYPNAEAVRRGVWFDSDSGRMTVADEVVLNADFAGNEIYHIFHSDADAIVADNGKTLYLIRNSGDKLRYITLCILSEGDEKFELYEEKPFDTSPNPDLWEQNISLGKTQAKNEGNKIIVRQRGEAGLNSLQIVFMPQGDGKNPYNAPKKLKSTDQW